MGGNRFVLPSDLQNTNIVDSASKIPGNLGAMTISTTRYNTTVSGAAIVDKKLQKQLIQEIQSIINVDLQ